MRSHPWRSFGAALAISLLVAVGFAVAVDRVTAGREPAPHLRSVSQGALAASGLTLEAATQPPYCGAEQAAAHAGWLRAGWAGCAIGRDAAEAAVMRLGSGQVVESLLARVTASGRQPGFRDRLAWVVVVRGGMVLLPAMVCLQRAPAGCSGPGTIQTRFLRVVVLDAFTGDVVTSAMPGFVQSPPVVTPIPMPPQQAPAGPRPLPSLPVAQASPQVRLVPPLGG